MSTDFNTNANTNTLVIDDCAENSSVFSERSCNCCNRDGDVDKSKWR